MIPCYNAKLCGNARRVTRVTRVTEHYVWVQFLAPLLTPRRKFYAAFLFKSQNPAKLCLTINPGLCLTEYLLTF